MRFSLVLAIAVILMMAVGNPVLAQTLDVPPPANEVGLDLNEHCQRHWPDGQAVLIGGTVNDWWCQDSTGSLHAIDMDRACGEQYNLVYGPNWLSTYADYNDPYSWTCQRWCQVQPHVGKYRWTSGKKAPAIQLYGPGYQLHDADGDYDIDFFFKGKWVGPDAVTNIIGESRYVGSDTLNWPLNKKWARQHRRYAEDELWYAIYRTAQNTCEFY